MASHSFAFTIDLCFPSAKLSQIFTGAPIGHQRRVMRTLSETWLWRDPHGQDLSWRLREKKDSMSYTYRGKLRRIWYKFWFWIEAAPTRWYYDEKFPRTQPSQRCQWKISVGTLTSRPGRSTCTNERGTWKLFEFCHDTGQPQWVMEECHPFQSIFFVGAFKTSDSVKSMIRSQTILHWVSGTV